jgi:DUF1365 family protein
VSSANASALYTGWVRHRRFGLAAHQLKSTFFTAYLDLDELPQALSGSRLWSASRRAIAEFRRSDHLGDPARPLADEVRALVQARTGRRPDGPIRLLTNLRYFGHAFNPVSFYFCFAAAEHRVQAIVAEVTNTPWGERHAYVLTPSPDRAPGAVMQGRFAKEFHVSPFMGMDYDYSWRITEPGEQLIVHIESTPRSGDGQPAFDATLSLQRRELTPAQMRRLLARHPMLSLRTVRQIYGHGLRLKLKGARYFPNPSGAPFIGAARRRHARRSREEAAL